MKKTKDSGVRSDLLLKPIPMSKKNSKGTPTAQLEQDTKNSLTTDLLSQMEKGMKNWKEFHHPHDHDELVHGREPSLRSSVRDESIEHVFCEDSVIVLSSAITSEVKGQNKVFEEKKGLFSGFPFDFREENIDYKEKTMNSSTQDGSGKGNLNKSEELTGNKKKQSEGSVNRVSPGNESFSKINGVIANPVPLFEGKPYLVMSVQNDLPENRVTQSPQSQKLYSSPLKSERSTRNSEGHEGLPLASGQDNVLKNEVEYLKIHDYIPGVHDLNAFLQDQLITNDMEKPKYREVSTMSNQGIDYHNDNEEIDYHQLAQRTDMITRAARRAFEEQYMMTKANDMQQAGQFFRKNLSVIFSTGKSMDTSMDSRESVGDPKEVNEASVIVHNENGVEKQNDYHQILKEGSFSQTENESDAKPPEQKKSIFSKEPELSEARESLKSRLNTSANGEKEKEKESKFMTTMQNLLIQNKENKSLEQDLLTLLEAHQEEMGVSQRRLNLMGEKIRKYKESNLSLVEVVKNWEKEIEQLAITNKNLHDLVIGLQEELFQSKKKEVEIKEIYSKQKSKLNKLKDRAKKDALELEEARKQLKSKENKISTIVSNTQGYESLIKTININLKALIKERNSNKIATEHIYKILEGVENKTSKFLKDIASSQVPVRSNSPLAAAFRDKLNVCLIEEPINPLNEMTVKSYRHPSPGEVNSSARGFNELKKYDSLPVSNRSGTQKSPLKKILTNPLPSQFSQKKSASPLYKSVLTPKEKPQNLPSYYTKKSLTHRLPPSGEKKNHPSLSYRAGEERGRSIEEEESSRQRKSKSREKSAPETKGRGTAKEKKRGSQQSGVDNGWP